MQQSPGIWPRRIVTIIAWLFLALGGSLAAAIAFGTAAAPQHSMPPRHLDLSGLPPLSRYAARDGAHLAYRIYPGGSEQVAVLIHGTGTESSVMNAAAKTLRAAGATVYAPDLRGSGSSGRRGDVDYIGQLDDDLADLVAAIRLQHPHAKMTLVGFSGGGAFAIRIAGDPMAASSTASS